MRAVGYRKPLPKTDPEAERVPSGHPLRKIRKFVNAALAALGAAFAELYSADGRPSIAPERLLRAAHELRLQGTSVPICRV